LKISGTSIVKRFFDRLYRKFDQILVLNEGEVTYFGPRLGVLSYFESIGFRCPENMNPADYLVSLMTHPDEYRIEGFVSFFPCFIRPSDDSICIPY
jgi:hypothetical protein